MVHLLSCRHGKLIQPWHIHLSMPNTLATRLTSALHRNNYKITIIMNPWQRSMKNTREEASTRRTPPLQQNPSLTPTAHLTPLHTFPAFIDNQYWPLITKEILTNTIHTDTTKYLPPPTLKRYDTFLSPFAEQNHTSALIHLHHSSNPTFNPLTPPFISSDIILRWF